MRLLYISFMVLMIASGVTPSYLFMLIGYSALTFIMSSTQPLISRGSAYSSILDMATLASATIGISTFIFLDMDAASISTCMILAFLANVSIVPVIRSLNLHPMEKSTSLSMIALLDAKLPCIPMLPTYSG